MTELWDAAGDRWEAAVDEVVCALKERNPSLRAQIGHDSSEFFALRGWASLSRDGTPTEDLAISLDFRHVDGGIECRADIARGNGQVLAETPASTLDASDDPGTLRSAVWTAMASVEAFLETNMELLAAELAAA